MVSTRFLGLVSTVLLVVGALAVGEALHRSVVTGEASLASPLILVYLGVGVVAILVGYRVRRPVGERYALGSDDDREGTGTPDTTDTGRETDTPESGDGEFDPSMSPLGDAAPGDASAPDDEPTAGEREETGSDAERPGTETHGGRADGDDSG